MTLSEKDLELLASSSFVREQRVFIGPPWPFLFDHVTSPGAQIDTLAADLVMFDETASLAIAEFTDGIPTAGDILILTDGTHVQWWYVVEVDGSDTHLRLVWGDRDATLSAGSGAYITYEITHLLDAPVSIREYEDLPFLDWDAALSGKGYNPALLRDGASIYVQERQIRHPAAGIIPADLAWAGVALGYLGPFEVDGDADGVRAWSNTARSIGYHVKRQRITTRQYGRVDLASSATVTASTQGDASVITSEAAEWPSGTGTTDPANAIDGNIGTLYISLVKPDLSPDTPGSGGSEGNIEIEQVMFKPPLGAPAGLQWIELRYWPSGGAQNLSYFSLTTKNTVTTPSSVSGWPPDLVSNFIRLPDVTLDFSRKSLVLVSDRQLFERYYNVSSGVQVEEWDAVGTVELEDEDTIHLRLTAFTSSGISPHITDMVAWGDVHFFTNDDGSQWPGAAVDVSTLAPGNTIRRKPTQTDTNSAADWAIEPRPVPGQAPNDLNGVYLSLEFDPFTTTLDEDITDSYLGPIEVVGADNLDTEGVLVIGAEHIAYTRDASGVTLTARGQNATTPAAHFTDDAISIYDATLGAHAYPLVESVELLRRRLTDDIIHMVQVYGSTELAPAMPESEAGWEEDWIGDAALVTHWNAEWAHRFTIALPEPMRLLHLAIFIREMTNVSDPTQQGDIYAKVNEIRVWRAQAEGAVSPYRGVGQVIDALWQELPATPLLIMSDAALTGTSGDRVIVEDTLGNILQEILDDYLLVLHFRPEGTVRLDRRAFHPLAAPVAPRGFLTPDMLRGLPGDYRVRTHDPAGIGQVVVKIYDQEAGQHYVGRYPPRVTEGEIETYDLTMAAPSATFAAQIAEALYWEDEARRNEYIVQTVGPANVLSVGDKLPLYDPAKLVAMSASRTPYNNAYVAAITHHDEQGVETLTLRESRR